jgi:crotonobetainyl-CoA:carnitine CoA-transferase CaiB-like acyl-CoA transferase
MLDTTIAMTDIVTNFWSMGLRGSEVGPVILTGFRATDGWFIIQVGREGHFAKLAEFVGHPEWVDDPRLATRQGWVDHLDTIIRPAVDAWGSRLTKLQACEALAAVGIPSGPCFNGEEVIADPHVRARDVLVEMDRPDGLGPAVVTPGLPIWMSRVSRGPETRVPWVGEHTDGVLAAELGLSSDELADLRQGGVIT